MQKRATDSALRRLFRNAGYLLGGKAVGAILHLAALAITGRALGPQAFGILILIHAVAQTASGFASSQTWQTLIQYGTRHLMAGRKRELRDLLAFCIGIDVAVGLAAMIVATGVVLVLAPAIGIPEDFVPLAAVYCLLVPTMAASTATGVLRLLDRFDILAVQGTVNPILRLVGVLLAAALSAPLWGYALAWFAADLSGDLLIWVTALREARRRGLVATKDVDPRRAWYENPGIGRFVLATNASSSVAALLGPASTLLIGAMLGPVAAGLYRIGLVLVEAAAKPGDLVTRAFLPEIARLRSVGDITGFWSLILRVLLLSLALAGGMIGVFVAFGDDIVAVVFGASYAGSHAIVAPASLALLGLLPAYFLDAAMLSLGLAGRSLLTRCSGAVALLTCLIVLLPRVGIAGAGWAYAVGATIVGLSAAIVLGRQWVQDQSRFAGSATLRPIG